ncbi:tyrosine-type recombinase/integrase [Deinococcus budaensis]|uniref:Integrase n=1 Tax=Deinococcus budaensis TaxID=1665626 RepID=A0A7W8GCR9_9DEIO|nr:site-specific integrase [Deinococcus budaensis]MBB5233177.1 integrase [Deinococcus budaensis]
MIEGARHSGTTDSKTAAGQQLARLIVDTTRGGVVDPSAETLGDYLTRWLAGKEKSQAVRTHEIQDGHLQRVILPTIGARRLQKLSPADLRRLFDHCNREGLGASSQRQVHQSLISALGEAHRLELVTLNVAEIVKPAPARGKERKGLPTFTPEEAAAFLAAAREDWRGPFFVFTLSTGMRRGEVTGLRWQDVGLEGGTARVQEIVTDSTAGSSITTPKTGHSRRTAYLSPDTVALLRAVRADQAQQAEALAGPVKGHAKGYERKRPWADSGRVFTNAFGATLDPHNLRRDMARICEAARVRYLPIHGLRYTYASLSLRRGVPVEVVSKQLGHASVAFTLTQYRTVFQSEREDWALNLDDLLTVQK